MQCTDYCPGEQILIVCLAVPPEQLSALLVFAVPASTAVTRELVVSYFVLLCFVLCFVFAFDEVGGVKKGPDPFESDV